MSSYINGRYVSTPFIRKAIMYWKHPCFFPNQRIRKKQDLIYPTNSVMALRFDAFKNFSNFSKEGFSLKLLLSPIICKKCFGWIFFSNLRILKIREYQPSVLNHKNYLPQYFACLSHQLFPSCVNAKVLYK